MKSWIKNRGSFSLEFAIITVIFTAMAIGVIRYSPNKILDSYENAANNVQPLNLHFDENYDAMFVSPFLLETKNARNCITVHFSDLEATGSGKTHNAMDIAMSWRCDFSEVFNPKNPNEYLINAIISGDVIEIVEDVETNTSNTCNTNPEGEGCHGPNGNFIKTITTLNDENGLPTMIKVLYYHIDKGSATSSGISVGSHIEQGQLIAREGHNGLSSGYHLHLEISISKDGGLNWTKIDPEAYIDWKVKA